MASPFQTRGLLPDSTPVLQPLPESQTASHLTELSVWPINTCAECLAVIKSKGKWPEAEGVRVCLCFLKKKKERREKMVKEVGGYGFLELWLFIC